MGSGSDETTDDFVIKHHAELSSRITTHGESHPAVAEMYGILGLFHHHVLSDQLAALNYHRQALQTLRQAQLSHHSCQLEMAITLTDIGNVYRSSGDDDRAKSSYQEALSIFSRCTPPLSDCHPALNAARRGILKLSRG